MKRLLFVMALAIAACSPAQPALFSTPTEQDIAEVALRSVFRLMDAGSEEGSRAAICFRDSEPGRKFRSRFQGLRPEVLRCSASPRHDLLGSVHRRAIGQVVIEYWVGEVKVVSEMRASVVAGYYENGLSAAAVRFDLERQNGNWVAVSHVVIAAS